MNGVEILSSETIYETDIHMWPLIVIPIIGLLIGLILSIVTWVKDGFDGQFILLTIGLTVACFVLGFVLTIATEHETDTVDYIEYKVTIDDFVSMNEFLDKYEILGQEGKIYTVKEKTND